MKLAILSPMLRPPRWRIALPLLVLLLAPPAVGPSLAQDDDKYPPEVEIVTAWTEINPGGQVVLTAEGDDIDGTPLEYEWTATAGGFLYPEDHWDELYKSPITWIAPDEAGDVVITVTVIDDDGLKGSDSVTLAVVTGNTAAPAVMLTPESRQVVPSGLLQLTATASDPDGGSVAYAWGATAGTFDATDAAAVTWTAPDEEDFGVVITVTVTDDEGDTASATARVSVHYMPQFTVEPGEVVALESTAMRITVTGGRPLYSNYRMSAAFGHWPSGSQYLPLTTDSEGGAVVETPFFAYQPDGGDKRRTIELQYNGGYVWGWGVAANMTMLIKRNTNPPQPVTVSYTLYPDSPNEEVSLQWPDGEPISVTLRVWDDLPSYDPASINPGAGGSYEVDPWESNPRTITFTHSNHADDVIVTWSVEDRPSDVPGDTNRYTLYPDSPDQEVSLQWPDGEPISVTLRVWDDLPSYDPASINPGAGGSYEVDAWGSNPRTITFSHPNHADDIVVWWTVASTAGKSVPQAPRASRLEPNYPNPFNSTTQIAYHLAEPGWTRLVIYNALGQPVRTLVDGFQATGAYEVFWDARDQQGAAVAAGVYVTRLIYPGGQETRRLLYLK